MKRKILISIFVAFLPFFGFSTNYSKFQDDLYTKYTKAEKMNKYVLVKNFCEEIVKQDRFDWKFEPKKSLFLQVLCEKTWINDWWKFESKIKLKEKWVKFYEKLKEDSAKGSRLWIRSWIFGKCRIQNWVNTDDESLNNVDFACVTSDIFDKLANDFINIATYFAYWGFDTPENMVLFEKDFYIWKICPKSYIYDEGSNSDTCKHSKTYKYYKNLVSGLNGGLKGLSLIETDKSKIYKDFSPEKETKQATMYLMTAKDYVYNELYFYSIFIWYYTAMIETNTWKFQLKATDIRKSNKDTQSESINAKDNITLARNSVKKSFTVIKDIYRTFPIHLWYMALYEDIGKLRESFAKLYTPLDQFRYKLKNVQDEDKF